MVLLGAFLWGTMVVFTKGASHLMPLTIATVRVALSTASGFLFFSLRKPSMLRIDLKDLRLVWFFGGFSVAFLYGGFTLALRTLSVATTEVIFFTFPLFTTLGGALLFREWPSPLQVLAGFVILSGVACMTLMTGGEAESTSQRSAVGLGAAVLSVVGMTMQSLTSRWNGREKRLPPWTFFIWMQASGLFWLALAKTFLEGWGDLPTVSFDSWLLLLYLGVVTTFLGYGVYNLGLTFIRASTASMLASFELVTAVTLAAVILKTPPSRGELWGCVIILVGLCLSARGASEAEE